MTERYYQYNPINSYHKENKENIEFSYSEDPDFATGKGKEKKKGNDMDRKKLEVHLAAKHSEKEFIERQKAWGLTDADIAKLEANAKNNIVIIDRLRIKIGQFITNVCKGR